MTTYLNERQVSARLTLREAAVLADEFALAHRMSFRDKHKSEHSPSGHNDKTKTTSNTDQACFYCKKPGHLVAECPVLRKKQTKNKAN